MNRNSKRFVIIGIYLVIIAVFISMVVALVIPNPTCFDEKKNQNEVGVDCGGVCAVCEAELVGSDLIIKDAYVVYGGEKKYDVVASIYNPNALFGAEKFYYTFEIIDADGTVLATRRGTNFMLPNENKHIVEVSLESDKKPSKVKATVEKVDWIKFANFDAPQILIKNQKFGLVESGTDYARAFGLVSNESPYDFQDVTINVILLDERGIPIAVNKTVQKTLDADEQREFTLNWPHEFPGKIASATMQAETNIFDSLNFMKKYLPSGKYQDLSSSEGN